jgi:glycosyltransferase involved in cell wall biosynthesis
VTPFKDERQQSPVIRVLHVIASFSGGGAERQIALLMRALLERGIDVHVAYMHEGPNSSLARDSGACMHRLQVAGNHDPRALRSLLYLVKRAVRPSIVQTWLLHADVFGGLAALLSGVPWLLSERNSGELYVSGLKNAFRRRLGLHADAIVANSRAGLEYWRLAGYKGEGAVIRNIVPTQHVSAIAPREADRPVDLGQEAILIVGRLEEQKNPMGVLSVLERVFAVRPGAQANFLGIGSMEAQLRAAVERSPVLRGNVLFRGFIPDVTPWLRHAKALFSFSRYEGTPNVVLESIAHGCPVIASDIPEHLELLGPASAWIAPLNDHEAAASVLLSALADSDEAKRRSESAIELLADFNAVRVAGQYADLYLRLLGATGAPAAVAR